MVLKGKCPPKVTYSYGIILLEIITRKKLTDEMFVGEVDMTQWIASLPDIIDVVDNGLLRIEDGRDVTTMQTILLSILDLGSKRYQMKDSSSRGGQG
jgi:hypothetical protein